jgi:hypothetical protein
MDTSNQYLLLFLCIFLFVKYYRSSSMIEGFPNETQFLICGTDETMGETDYVEQTNSKKLSKSNQFYSSLLELTGEKRFPNYHKSPLCGSKIKKSTNDYFNNNLIIDTSNNEWESLVDPLYKYSHPENEDSILYPSDIYRDEILKQKRKNNKSILNRSL